MKFRLFSAVDGLLRTRVSKIFAEKSGGIRKKEEKKRNDISGCLLIFDYPFRAYFSRGKSATHWTRRYIDFFSSLGGIVCTARNKAAGRSRRKERVYKKEWKFKEEFTLPIRFAGVRHPLGFSLCNRRRAGVFVEKSLKEGKEETGENRRKGKAAFLATGKQLRRSNETQLHTGPSFFLHGCGRSFQLVGCGWNPRRGSKDDCVAGKGSKDNRCTLHGESLEIIVARFAM